MYKCYLRIGLLSHKHFDDKMYEKRYSNFMGNSVVIITYYRRWSHSFFLSTVVNTGKHIRVTRWRARTAHHFDRGCFDTLLGVKMMVIMKIMIIIQVIVIITTPTIIIIIIIDNDNLTTIIIMITTTSITKLIMIQII